MRYGWNANVFRELEDMHRALDNLRRQAPWERPFSRFSFLPGWQARAYPLLNLSEDKDAFYVEALAPGVDPESLDVSIQGNQLTIAGEKTANGKEEIKSDAYHRNERAAGRFVRSLTLDAEVEADQISAQYEKGILTITVPKAETAKPRQIAVKVN